MWPCTRAQMSGFFLASLLEWEKAESHMHPPTLPTQTPKTLVPAEEGGEGYRHSSVATEGASPGQSRNSYGNPGGTKTLHLIRRREKTWRGTREYPNMMGLGARFHSPTPLPEVPQL